MLTNTDNRLMTPQLLGHFQRGIEQALAAYIEQMGEKSALPLYARVMGEIEPTLLKSVLSHTDFNRSDAAKILGVCHATLNHKLKHYGLGQWIKETRYRHLEAITSPKSPSHTESPSRPLVSWETDCPIDCMARKGGENE